MIDQNVEELGPFGSGDCVGPGANRRAGTWSGLHKSGLASCPRRFLGPTHPHPSDQQTGSSSSRGGVLLLHSSTLLHTSIVIHSSMDAFTALRASPEATLHKVRR